MSRIALVTGAGQGIGLELCRQLLAAGDRVVACPRVAGSRGLGDLAATNGERLDVVPMDVADSDSRAAARKTIEGRVERLDLLFNNAGVYPKGERGLDELDTSEVSRAFEVNAVGPIVIVKTFLPLLRRGRDKRLVQITSLMGSIADNGSGGSWAYRVSKAALNMVVRNLGHELGPEGFVSVAVHPGWVQTRMGGAGAPTALDACVRDILDTTAALGPNDNGRFIDRLGEPLPY
jgi:NAD(P)-dependent dehydrogenase (short-subunit alcohol dehydrogenase family)